MTLVEASPYDTIWGIGLDAEDPQAIDRNQWRGMNLLGRILTNVREQIIRESTTSGRGTRHEEERVVKDGEHTGGTRAGAKEGTTSGPVKLDRNFANRQKDAGEVATGKDSKLTVKDDSGEQLQMKMAVESSEDDSGEQFEFFSGDDHPFRLQYPCEFEVDGHTFSSAEQHMFYCKASKLFVTQLNGGGFTD